MSGNGPVVLILAAGRGERFTASGGEGHKLEAMLAGRSVLDRTLAAVAAAGLESYVVRPPGGTVGMGATIAMGVRATADASGWLILPGDLPLIGAATLQHVAMALKDSPLVVPHYDRRQGHPVGFGQYYREALLALSGDVGAAAIVRTARTQGEVRDIMLNDAGIVHDIDTLDDLYAARKRLNDRRSSDV
ncbi:nucleotidyltransferase family protein [Erwinia oleae]|uniref:nucleotidyltransferase family protein n=1 Tax=Erwinia oleae TaxID=796334 RepID=UPI00055432F7|nr:NTP transferase domain-containing protein [Erwinia oleae]